MTYFQKDLFPEYESESSPGPMQLISDFCCNGCICTSDKDHEFVMEEIDFEQ
jgi:hypothetical protein